MKWFAQDLGYGEEAGYWSLAGLLHDVDFECYPEEHCKKAPGLLAEIQAGEDLTHSVCSHGYGICSDVEPAHTMEKVLFATDELTGLIGAAVKMRPSKSVMDIRQGAEMLGWELDELFCKTIEAMKSCETSVQEQMKAD